MVEKADKVENGSTGGTRGWRFDVLVGLYKDVANISLCVMDFIHACVCMANTLRYISNNYTRRQMHYAMCSSRRKSSLCGQIVTLQLPYFKTTSSA